MLPLSHKGYTLETLYNRMYPISATRFYADACIYRCCRGDRDQNFTSSTQLLSPQDTSYEPNQHKHWLDSGLKQRPCELTPKLWWTKSSSTPSGEVCSKTTAVVDHTKATTAPDSTKIDFSLHPTSAYSQKEFVRKKAGVVISIYFPACLSHRF